MQFNAMPNANYVNSSLSALFAHNSRDYQNNTHRNVCFLEVAIIDLPLSTRQHHRNIATFPVMLTPSGERQPVIAPTLSLEPEPEQSSGVV